MKRPSNDIILIKKFIADFNKDINVLKKEIKRKTLRKEELLVNQRDYLDSNYWTYAKELNSTIRGLSKDIENLTCAMKTLETVRKPYSDACIKLRMLYAIKTTGSYHHRLVSNDIFKIKQKLNLI